MSSKYGLYSDKLLVHNVVSSRLTGIHNARNLLLVYEWSCDPQGGVFLCVC